MRVLGGGTHKLDPCQKHIKMTTKAHTKSRANQDQAKASANTPCQRGVSRLLSLPNNQMRISEDSCSGVKEASQTEAIQMFTSHIK